MSKTFDKNHFKFTFIFHQQPQVQKRYLHQLQQRQQLQPQQHQRMGNSNLMFQCFEVIYF